MKNLKHKILELITGDSKSVKLEEVMRKHHLDDQEVNTAFEELDQSEHAVYTRTLEGVRLVANLGSKKAFEDGVYLETEGAPKETEKPSRVGGKFAKKVNL